MRFLAGIITGFLLVGLAAVLFMYSGVFNASANIPPSKLEQRLADLALDKSVARRAPRGPNPLAGSAEALPGGMAHYKEMCVFCHGAPGVDASEAGDGLNPPAPDLTLAKVQKRTDGELFWILQNGIRMTGMPAFGPTHKDEELWKMVAFLRHLPELTAEEQESLRPKEGSDHHAETPDHHAKETPAHKH
jgi:mono/diheme cytochrome c family protein